jgi:hypothetical protein
MEGKDISRKGAKEDAKALSFFFAALRLGFAPLRETTL